MTLLGNDIALQFTGEKKVNLIDLATGKFRAVCEMPRRPRYEEEFPSITPSGITYEIVCNERKRALISGKISDGQWNKSFDFEIRHSGANEKFIQFSSHCGLFTQSQNRLILFNPGGASTTIENCLAVESRDDKLYVIEKNSANQNQCFLTVRTLKETPEVVSDVEKSILLDKNQVFFGNLCNNGQWILFRKDKLYSYPVFVDLTTETVTHSEYCLFPASEYVINTESGELWTWNPFSHEAWNVSSTGTKPMQPLEKPPANVFSYVDPKKRLYLVNPLF